MIDVLDRETKLTQQKRDKLKCEKSVGAGTLSLKTESETVDKDEENVNIPVSYWRIEIICKCNFGIRKIRIGLELKLV